MAIRHFLKDDDISVSEQAEILALAAEIKRNPGQYTPLAGNQSVAVLFDKTSTRTRFSFDAGIAQLGGNAIVVDSSSTQMGKGETLADSARTLSCFVKAIVWRTFHQADIEELAQHSSVPVINSLTDDYHPCQILADLQTIAENFDQLSGLNVTYIGDADNNMATSYAIGFAMAGINMTFCAPSSLHVKPEIADRARDICAQTGASFTQLVDPQEAATQADVLITDTWVSMGKEHEQRERLQLLDGYRLTQKLLSGAADNAIVLHCLPAYRGQEIDAEVIDGPQSRVWDEAENRLHAQNALMIWLLKQAES